MTFRKYIYIFVHEFIYLFLCLQLLALREIFAEYYILFDSHIF